VAPRSHNWSVRIKSCQYFSNRPHLKLLLVIAHKPINNFILLIIMNTIDMAEKLIKEKELLEHRTSDSLWLLINENGLIFNFSSPAPILVIRLY
jgi:cytochrome b involved in lipid metabolism